MWPGLGSSVLADGSFKDPARSGTEAVRLLVVDDSESVRYYLEQMLTKSGYETISAVDGREGLRLLHNLRPSLVLTDMSMGGMEGLEFIGRIRELSDIPVIVLSVDDSEQMKVQALQSGADDYVVKPVLAAELVARIQANLRRMVGPPLQQASIYQDAALYIDCARHEIEVQGSAVDLTPQEFRLLNALVDRPGVVLSTEQLMDICWGDSEGGPESVREIQKSREIGVIQRKCSAVGVFGRLQLSPCCVEIAQVDQ